MRLDNPPNWGSLHVRFVEAEYLEDFVEGPPHTYCVVWLLEKVRWRRRKSKPRGRGEGENPMHPVWGDEFELDDVRDDSKLALDVWNVKQGAEAEEEYFGKVWLTISDALLQPISAWHDLVPGRLQVMITWTPYHEGELGEPISLTLPPSSSEDAPTGAGESRKQEAAKSTSTLPPLKPPKKPSVESLDEDNESSEDFEDVTELRNSADQQYENDEFEEEAAWPSSGQKLKIEYHEYTHRGGTGNGPKENQDAYFVKKLDDSNFIFGVFDGHGHDNGKLAAKVASDTTRVYLTENFAKLRSEPDKVMHDCFERCNKAIFAAIQAQPDTFLRDGTLVMEVEESDWELGYDAVDGGTTASVAAVVDGRTLIYASVGDSCGVFAKPNKADKLDVFEIVPEHSPTNMKDWEERLHKSGALVVYDHPDMFEGPEHMLHVFCRDGKGGWKLDDESLRRADEAGCGYKTERGDRAAVILTPEEGKFSQMMLGVTRSLGDFYHQQYGVTWEPEIVVHDLAEMLGAAPF
ncbi:MAG: hypothetical protein SGPRY_004154, partial [Prymnesium sp.]